MAPGPNGRRNSHLFSNFPTHEPLFRQGHVGDLRYKTKTEIEELLERQEKLLSNRNFVSRLPDRGAKIEQFILSLKRRLNEIESQESDSSLADSLDDTTSSTDTCNTEPSTSNFTEPSPMENKQKSSGFESSLSVIEKGFSDLTIHEGPHYEVVKKASEKPKPSKFMLNRLKNKNFKVDSAATSTPTRTEKLGLNPETKRGSKKNERHLSAATIRDPKRPSVLISVEESRSLYQKQEAVVKEQRSQLAAERILSKYSNLDSSQFSLDDDDDSADGELEARKSDDDLDDVD